MMRFDLSSRRGWRPALATTITVVAVLAAGAPAGAAGPDQVDILLDRLFGAGDRIPYVLTADFSGFILASVAGAQLRADAEGSFQEWRGKDNIRRRTVAADTASDVQGVGRVTGHLVLTFSNHCINCTHP